MDNLIAQPWVQELIDFWLKAQEHYEELPWAHFDEWLSRFIFYYPLSFHDTFCVFEMRLPLVL